MVIFFFFQAEDGIRDIGVTGVQTCALPIYGNKDKREFILKYINNLHDMYEGKVCLCFYGANGTGKTLLASILVREAYRHRYSSSIVTLSRLIDLTFSANKSQEDIELLDYIRNSEFLVIDEVGKENFNKTGSNINLLESILRQATTQGQIVILCTNLPLKGEGGLYEQYGASIKSLIAGNYVKLEFTGNDYRPFVTKQKKAMELLR